VITRDKQDQLLSLRSKWKYVPTLSYKNFN